MEIELNVSVGGLQGRMQMTGRGHTGHEVAIDYTPPLGGDQGFTSLELLLVSLGSCSAHTIKFLLEKMGKTVEKLDVRVTGKRRMDQHPTVVTSAHLTYDIAGTGLDRATIDKVVKMAEEQYCPVWAMLRNNVAITWECAVRH